jgi:hypothetical protein
MEPATVSGQSYDAALERFDQGLLDALETSISPMQTLRTVLRGLSPPARREGKRRDEE